MHSESLVDEEARLASHWVLSHYRVNSHTEAIVALPQVPFFRELVPEGSQIMHCVELPEVVLQAIGQ